MNDMAYLEQRLKFEREINEVNIKRVILYHIQRADNEEVIKALQDLFKDIYVVPDDIFETHTVDELINEIKSLGGQS